ncbi:non-ribosomal peptide synthetase [Pseudomonas rubra]|uniref:Amino acid adenylation domain-containing protein n=1 Tax=Pseudomonas rubra TaxID=2942627 RepID=A0ABT5P6J1_9PSED|nr:non-ribosomal peptide synthetase [Pseudomonas rubra]MDD1013905.1 amino acid adenylation domain-containing protein [Pseudomonas rubra]MDD1038274.1 amino acid adenylation domain-containing protein [Pseudomonas rubra]MDD1154636.1 amino acid adenylation domain-containing protein [Pseudomonas rubra]
MPAAHTFALTASQRDIWLDQISHGDSPRYNVGAYVDFDGDIDAGRLRQALVHLMGLHESLRTVLVAQGEDNGVPRQCFTDALAVDLSEHDLRASPEPLAAAQALMKARLQRPYALEVSPLWGTMLIRLAERRYLFAVHTHHLILDGWGIDQMFKQTVDCYRLLEQGQPLPDTAPSYRDFIDDDAHYQQSTRQARDRDYWLAKYKQLPDPLLAPRERGVLVQAEPTAALELPFDAGLLTRMRQLAQDLQASAFHVLLAALHVCCARTWQRDEWVLGLPVRNRSNARFKATMGLFSQVSALHMDFGRSQSFAALVRAIGDTLKQDFRHQRFSLSDLNRALGAQREERSQLFELMLSYEEDDNELRFGQTASHSVMICNGHGPTPLSIHLRSNSHSAKACLHLVYSHAWFSAEEVQALAERLLCVLEQGLQRPELSIAAFDLLTDSEHARLHAWNATSVPAACQALIHRRIEAQAGAWPHAVAALHNGQQLSYGELNRRADILARHLIALGTQPEQRVAVVARRGLDTLVGLLAVLKSGAAYVPIDPAQPRERLAYLLDDSAPQVVLTQASLSERLPAHGRPQIELDCCDWSEALDSRLVTVAQSANNLAYVIYTSGSTGEPKGVMVEHRMLANLVDWSCSAFELGPGRQQSCLAGFGFDAMAWEVWPALCSGATLHLAPVRDGAEDIEALLRWWRAQPLDVSFLPTPVAEHAFAQGELHPTLKTLLVGGDRLRRLGREQRYRVINNYGPTEATVVATAGQVQAGQPLHIGAPVANTRVYVLDGQHRLLPIGAVGELYIGGSGVARGYLNRPQLTAERFLNDPFSDAANARMYRTGDLVRWNADGNLEYLGRNDDQVKIRGVRVELAEIEAALASHPRVRECVVLLRNGQLQAWFIGDAAATPLELHEHLRQRLSAALLPGAYTHLRAWPLTANGKLDRRALPVADDAAKVRRVHEAPQGEVEQRLAALWAELLKVERVGRQDHFFELGGHSLLAVQLIGRMRQQGLQADVQVLYGQSTLASLAAAVVVGEAAQVPANRVPVDCQHITPELLVLTELDQAAIERIVATVPGGAANVQEIYPLAPLQQGLLYHHVTDARDPYQQQVLFAFADPHCLAAFAQALQRVIERHDILRTSLVWEDLEQPQQVVWRKAHLQVETWNQVAQAGDVGAQLRSDYDPQQRPLDLRRAPMMALVTAEDRQQGRWLGLLRFHHLVNDAVSIQVLLGELEAFMAGGGEQLPEPVAYRDYVALSGAAERQARHQAFFREQLAGVEAPVPIPGLGGAVVDEDQLHTCSEHLDDVLTATLRTMARQQGASLASLLHLAWAQVLGTLAVVDEVTVGTVLLGRAMAGKNADRAMGMFINSLPLRVNLAGQSVSQALVATHGRLAALLGHEDAPLLLAQRCSGLAAGTPLFNSLINYRYGAVVQGQVLPGVTLVEASEVLSHGLVLTVDDQEQTLQLAVRAPRAIGAQRLLDALSSTLRQLGQALAEGGHGALEALCSVPAAELQCLLHGFNNTDDRKSPLDQTLPALFEAQVRRTPQAIALQSEEASLDYQTLNAQANRLAHRLLSLGVGPDTRVAVCVERGVAMMVALLGVLKAGGAYVPLDPGYPAERLQFLLADSAPQVLLVHGATRGLFEPSRVTLLDLDQDAWQVGADQNPQVPGLGPAQLAYVMYTSGSTGTPKGVMIEHRGLCNLMHWGSQICPPRPGDALLQRAPFTFDGSVWELFWPLTAGLRLVLARPDGHRDPAYLVQLIQARQVTLIKFVPALLHQFLEEPGVEYCTSLTDIFCGGGELTLALLASVRQRLPKVRLHNVYGPTEATVDSTAWTLRADEPLPLQVPPIGRPIANTQLYVLDAHDRPVPLGAVGQLHIGGVGVARGYLGLPDLQAQRFIASPFVDGDRLYRTGDLVRYRQDGQLDFLGRNDFQVKLRGLRVELGEIEALLVAHPAISQCVVLMREERLVAYFTCCEGARTPALEVLRNHLLARMPEYMVPSAYVALAQLPLSSNGKVDRQALPAPGAEAVISRTYQAPQGELETALADIWTQVLKIEQVGRDDNFFELGGHSLLAVNLVARMRQAGLHVDARTLFSQPTLAGLAASTQRQPLQVAIPETTIPSLGTRRRL